MKARELKTLVDQLDPDVEIYVRVDGPPRTFRSVITAAHAKHRGEVLAIYRGPSENADALVLYLGRAAC